MLQESGLPATRASQHDKDFTSIDLKGDIIDDNVSLVSGSEVFNSNNGVFAHAHTPSNPQIIVDHRENPIRDDDKEKTGDHGTRR